MAARLAAMLAVFCALAGQAGAEAARNWRLSFEVLSDRHVQPNRKATYEEKERLTRAALAEIVPYVWTTLDAEASRARSRVRPGGYGDAVNPAIHSNLLTTETEARRLAAGLGYVFRQAAVLMYDINGKDGDLRFVSVRFPRGTLTRQRAEAFFAAARGVLKSDKLGFSALGSRMVFINIRTGIADDAFAAGLVRAAESDATIKVEPPVPARAVLIENDWDKAKEGEDYAKLFADKDGKVEPALAKLRRRFDGRVRRWAHFLR
ncbi:MAG: hypothetical protein KIT16_22210 [Rhodospirillaceae bacterium]|nr:hypothetical protein [Rhodospirillaceae bacterium]